MESEVRKAATKQFEDDMKAQEAAEEAELRAEQEVVVEALRCEVATLQRAASEAERLHLDEKARRVFAEETRVRLAAEAEQWRAAAGRGACLGKKSRPDAGTPKKILSHNL